jgi:hypothetical protein
VHGPLLDQKGTSVHQTAWTDRDGRNSNQSQTLEPIWRHAEAQVGIRTDLPRN